MSPDLRDDTQRDEPAPQATAVKKRRPRPARRGSHHRQRNYEEATIDFNIEHRRSFNKGRTQGQKVCQNPKKVRRMVRQAIKLGTLQPRPE
jgi:hypothetical protein